MRNSKEKNKASKRAYQFAKIIHQIREWVADGNATEDELAAVLREMFRRNSDAAANALRMLGPREDDLSHVWLFGVEFKEEA